MDSKTDFTGGFLDFYNKQTGPLFDGYGNVIGYNHGYGNNEMFDTAIPKDQYKGSKDKTVLQAEPGKGMDSSVLSLRDFLAGNYEGANFGDQYYSDFSNNTKSTKAVDDTKSTKAVDSNLSTSENSGN